MARVLITGASRGIGLATAKQLLQEGYDVIGTCRNPSAEAISDELPFLKLDLSDKLSIHKCSREAGDIDILINNAGISQMGAVEETPVEKIRELFEVNFFGLVELTQAFLPEMREKRKGFIINIGSLAGKFAVPFRSSYVASKFALAGFSWSLRNEVMPFGIKVTVIEPAEIQTTIDPEFFSSENSEYIENLYKVKNSRDANMKAAPAADIVAGKISGILSKFYNNDKQPDPFYAVGKNASLKVAVKRFFPDSFVEKQVKGSYGLK